MKSPIIGIVCVCGPDPSSSEREIFYVGKPYVDRVIEAGGLPVLIPHGTSPEDVIDLIDGWMVIGGRDIDPARYSQSVHPASEQESASRFEMESKLFDIKPPSMPLLGICYGCQFLNIKHGGDLIQHLPDQLGNDDHSGGTIQSYHVEEGSLTATALGTTVANGRSYHHQAIGRTGEGLKVVAQSADGVIEAIEDPGSPWVIGVQWHPERTPENRESIHLFKTFVDQARRFAEEKVSCGTW